MFRSNQSELSRIENVHASASDRSHDPRNTSKLTIAIRRVWKNTDETCVCANAVFVCVCVCVCMCMCMCMCVWSSQSDGKK